MGTRFQTKVDGNIFKKWERNCLHKIWERQNVAKIWERNCLHKMWERQNVAKISAKSRKIVFHPCIFSCLHFLCVRTDYDAQCVSGDVLGMIMIEF